MCTYVCGYVHGMYVFVYTYMTCDNVDRYYSCICVCSVTAGDNAEHGWLSRLVTQVSCALIYCTEYIVHFEWLNFQKELALRHFENSIFKRKQGSR